MGKARTMSRARGHSGASSNSRGGSDAWQPPSLTASERAYMIRKAKEASVALVDHAHTLDGPVQWHYTGKFRGIQMYRGEGSYDRVGTTGTEFLCGVTTMMGSIEEVASYFDQQTTEQMFAKKAEDMLDCGVLYSLVRGDPNNPFYRVSAKYQLYEGPSAFSRERDYCFLECQNTFRHASGRRGWVLSMHSIKLPNCPEVDGVVRGSMYQSGYVFVESEKDGYMDVMHSLQINFKSTSRLPHFLLNSALKRRILSVVTISREIQTARMGRQTLLKKKDLMPKRARALCVNCSRKFSLFVRKTRCRVCGEVVCQPCAPQVMISTKRGPVKTRVCTKCYHLSPGDEYEPIGALPNSQNGGDPRRMQNDTRYSDILEDHSDMYHEADEDSMDEDEDEDGLEEQSDYSVFAQSRFTEASRDSVATSNFETSSHFESQFEGSSQFDATSELDDSQYYDGGVSETSFVSGTSTSQWQGGNSTASSMVGWDQGSTAKPANGYIYDPQASTINSNFYGTSNYGESDYGASNYTVEEEPDKRAGTHKAAAPIPEDEPDHHNGYIISPNTSHISGQSRNYNSSKASNLNSTQGTNYDSSYVSYDSKASHASKTVSIQSLAKARSAHYGIKSQFPPPPPPPLSPPPEEADEDGQDDSPLHLGALKADTTQPPKPKGIVARKMFTPPPPKGRCENESRTSVNRVPKVPQKEFRAAVVSRDSRISQASSRESSGFSSTRSSAILQQMRRNRNRTLELTPGSDRPSAVLKTLEEEHLNRMREIERMQDLAKEKAARQSMASNGSRSSIQSARSSQSGGRSTNDRASAAFAAAAKKTAQPRRNAPLSPSGSPPGAPGSPLGPPPGSPPGTPPSMRGRPFNQQANQSFGNHSQRTDTSSDFGGSRFLSARSNGTFAKSNMRVSVAPSALSEDLMFNSQRSGFQARNGSNSSSRGRRLDASRTSSKSSRSSRGSRRLDASHASSTRTTKHPNDLTFDASQLSVDKAKFSSSIAILETPTDSSEHVAMMERSSSQRGSNDSTLFDEDLLAQSSAGMTGHINSMRARAAYQLPDEKDRVSDELLKRQQEHRRRMEELTKMTANHVVEDSVRDSASSLGDLHDSSISLDGFHNSSGSHFSDSSASSVDIDDDEFDFECRPLGRTKRSGTIPFSLEELGQVPDADDDEEQSEGPDDSDMSFRMSDDPMDHERESESMPPYRPSEEPVEYEHNGTLKNVDTSYRPSVETLGHERPSYSSSEESLDQERPSYSSSEESLEHERPSQLAFRASEESVKYERSSQPAYRASEDSVEHERSSQPPYRASEESLEHATSESAEPGRRSSEESVQHERVEKQAHAEVQYHSSEGYVERRSESKNAEPTYLSSEESVERKSEPAYRSSEELKSASDRADSAYQSSDESEGEDAEAAYRSSKEPVAPEASASHFSPYSSQLIPGEGNMAVDEFFAESSTFMSNDKLSQVDERGDGDDDTRSQRDTSDFNQDDLQFIPEEHITQEYKQLPISSSTISTEASEHVSSPRESCVSALDESLMNRPTEELFEQVRGNRPMYSNGTRSSDLQLDDLEASHVRRMDELNRIALDHLGNRMSSLDDDMYGSSYQPGLSLHPIQREDEEDEEMQWRSTDVMEEYQGRHKQDMERLRRKIRQLEEECRESIASVLTPEEMDLSEFEYDDEEPSSVDFSGQSFNAGESFNGARSFNPPFVSTKDLSSSSMSLPMLPQVDEAEPGSARALYAQIAKLTQLQREMAMTEDDDDAEEYRARIKEQYRLLRAIKAASFRLRMRVPRSPRKPSDWLPGIHEKNCVYKSKELPSRAPSKRTLSNKAHSVAVVKHGSTLGESCVSAFDESLMNRPTEELFEQVRANRPKHAEDAMRSSDLQLHDLDASHNRRMEELNRIALDQLGNRISNLDDGRLGSSYQDGGRLGSSYQPHSSQLNAGEGGTAVDEFFAGSSMVVASTGGMLAQVAQQRGDRDGDARSSRETSASQQDIDEEHSSKSEAEYKSNADFDTDFDTESVAATDSKSERSTERMSSSALSSNPKSTTSVHTSSLTTGSVVATGVLASSALSMSALSSSVVTSGVVSTTAASTTASKRVSALDESCVSAFDESLMNRPTEELFEQVRANRPKHAEDAVRSSDLQLHDLDASHNRRMEELNRIALDQLGNRISNLDDGRLGSSYQPLLSLQPGANKQKEAQSHSTDVAKEFKSRNQLEMVRLRRKIRQLEQECLGSGASQLVKEMDLSELDDNDKKPIKLEIESFKGTQSFHGDQSFNPQSSFISIEDLSSSTRPPPKLDEREPARALHDELAKMTVTEL